MLALRVQMADADRAEAVREVPESILGQPKSFGTVIKAFSAEQDQANRTPIRGLRRVVLHGRAFDVAEHGAEVFDWASRIGWERRTFDWLDSCLRPETTFLDIGAWIGVMTLHASGRCKRIVAVEPDPVAFKTLFENCVGLADLRQLAIGRDGTVKLGSGYLGASTTRKNGIGGRIGESTEFFTSECISLSKFAATEGMESPLCVKVDAEGMEEEILGSGLEFLETYRPHLFVELHPYWWFKPEEMEQTLAALKGIYSHVEQHGEHISFRA